jgi:hypothetical protein
MGEIILKLPKDIKELNEDCITFKNTIQTNKLTEQEQNIKLKKFIQELDEEIEQFKFTGEK